MRLAYLTTEYPALSHSFIRREIAAVEALGHEVLRFSIRRPPPSPAVEDRAEAARTRLVLAQGPFRLLAATLAEALRGPRRWARAAAGAWGLWRRSGRGAVTHLAYLMEACWLVGVLRRAGVTHLHAHFGTNPAAVALLVRRLGGPPFSFTVHGPDEFDRPAALDLGGKVAEATAAVAISSFGRAQLMRWSAPADWPKLHVVRCGIDAGFAAAADRPPPDAPVLVAVARLSAQKGLPLLVAAAAHLHAAGRAFRLRIVGEGPLRPALERQIAAAGLGAVVELVGALDGAGVAAAIQGARAFVLPSFAEGLPVVLMEALALRRPVIASRIAGTPELVDAACGWLVAAGAVDELAAALAAALDATPATLAAMGAAGRARVLAAHDAAANAAALVRLFGEAR